MKLNLKICLSLVVSAIFFNFATAEIVPGLETYGDLTLVDSIECATDTQHSFREFPAGRSYVSNILGQACIVMHHVKTSETSNGNESSAYISWRIGKGKNLVPSDPYLFVVEYPDDAPRSSTIINRGAPTRRGFHTGITVGDALSPPYVMNFPESYEIPLTQGFEKIEQVMYLVEKAVTYNEQGSRMDTSVEGFDIAFALFPQEDQKASHGVAIKSIKLYHINDEAGLKAEINYPKGNTPRRVVTFREEMSDDGGHASFADPVQWYRNKGRLMSVLGMNTYSRDLLEFGYCQYWDPSYNNYGSGWMNYNYEMRGLWEQVVTVMGEQGHNLFPLYEYAGGRGASDSLGNKKLVKPLFIDTKSDAKFNNQTYQEDCLVDITSAEAIADFKKVLDCTIIRFKDKANFLGSWVRSRGQMPVSFHENTVALFCQEKGYDSATVTRRYIADQGMNSDIYKEYMAWWYLKRVEFFNEMQKYLEENGVANAKSFYTSCPAETGEYAYNWWGGTVANNDTWANVSGESAISVGAATWNYNEYCLKREWPTWGNYEFFHTTPTDDPQNYENLKNVGLTYPFNRVYTVVGGYDKSWRNSSDDLFFVRHHSLNENALTDENGTHILGYYTADFEKAGRGCMLSELWSMAICDPTMIGYLFGYDLGRNNAKPVREFNQNFLALPATKSTVVSGGYWGAELTVRRWDTEESGTYFAVINTSTKEFKNQNIKFTNNSSEFDKIYRVVGGQKYAVTSGAIDVDIQPLEMITFCSLAPTGGTATLASSEVTHESATISAEITSIGATESASATLVVSTSEDYSSPILEYTEAITTIPSAITKQLSNLVPLTTYYCQLTVTTLDGNEIIRKVSFTTESSPLFPEGIIQLTPVDENNATLDVDVTKIGQGSTSVTFELTLTPEAEGLPTITYTTDALTATGAASFNVSGMSSEVAYNVTAVLKNNGGSTVTLPAITITMPELHAAEEGEKVSYKTGLTQIKYGCNSGAYPNYEYDFSSLDSSAFDITLGPVMADVQDSGNGGNNPYVNPVSGLTWSWANYTTYAYHGEMFFEQGVTYNFASIIDDGSTLFINGEKLFENKSYTTYGKGSFTPTATGWYPIEIYIFDWTGGKGPSGAKNNKWTSYEMGFGWNTNGVTDVSTETDWSTLRTEQTGNPILRTQTRTPVLVELNPIVVRSGDTLIATATTKAVDSDSVLYVYTSSTKASNLDPSAWTNQGFEKAVALGSTTTECELANVEILPGETTWVVARLVNTRTGYDEWSDVVSYTAAESLSAPEVALALTSAGYKDVTFSVVASSIGSGSSASVIVEIYDSNGQLVATYTPIEGATAPATVSFTTPYELAYNTSYTAKAIITNDDEETSESAEISFTTLEATPPAGELSVSNVGYTTAKAVVSITSFGVDCTAADVTLQVSTSADFSSVAFEEVMSGVASQNAEFNVAELSDNTTYYARAVIANANSISVQTEVVEFTTLQFSSPTVGEQTTGAITFGGATVTLPVTGLGDGSDSITAVAVLNDGTTVSAELDADGNLVFNFGELEPSTEYTGTITVTGSNGKQTVVEISFTTERYPLALEAPSAMVTDDGKTATISVAVDWLDISSANLALYINNEEVSSWTSVVAGSTYTYEATTKVGETYAYEFVLSDAANPTTKVSALGSFISQSINGWFAVKFEDAGYVLGAGWTNVTAVTEPGGTWAKDQEDITELVSDASGKYLQLKNLTDVPLVYTPTTSSLEGKDVRIEGRVKFVGTDAEQTNIYSAQFGLQMILVDEKYYPIAYCNGTSYLLSGPAVNTTDWCDYSIEFDYSSVDAPQAQVFINDILYPVAATGDIWIPLGTSKRNVSKVGFIGTGSVGNFSGSYYDTVVEDDEGDDIVLVVPEIGSSTGSGLEFNGSGADQVFSITISNPVPGAYYTPFYVNELGEEIWRAAIDSVQAAIDGMLVLDIDSSQDDTMFVKIVVSYPESYKAGDEKTFE